MGLLVQFQLQLVVVYVGDEDREELWKNLVYNNIRVGTFWSSGQGMQTIRNSAIAFNRGIY